MLNAKAIPALLALAAIVSSAATGRVSTAAARTECGTAQVHYTPYPGGAPGLGQLPWVRGTSRGLGLVGLLWYWPTEWRDRQIDRRPDLSGRQGSRRAQHEDPLGVSVGEGETGLHRGQPDRERAAPRRPGEELAAVRRAVEALPF